MECWRIYPRACINLENALMEDGMLSRFTRNLIKLLPALGLIAAGASPLAVVEYQLPRAGAFPHDPAVGGDGIVWYTDQQNSFIGRLDPATGKITDYPTPTPASGPHGIVVAPDGSVWYTAQRIGKLGRLDPKTGHIEEYSLPAAAGRKSLDRADEPGASIRDG